MDIGGGRVDGWEALASKYRKIRILGSGLNGSVYLAEHKTLGVYRAIKIVPKLNNHLFEEFRKEAQILKNLHHPGIPIIYDLEESKEAMYLVEEYMQGKNLYSRVHEIGVMPYQELVTFALALCRPMDYLHKQSIFHLDIQPGNLIIKDGQVSIIDFDHSQKQDSVCRWLWYKRICGTRTIYRWGIGCQNRYLQYGCNCVLCWNRKIPKQ